MTKKVIAIAAVTTVAAISFLRLGSSPDGVTMSDVRANISRNQGILVNVGRGGEYYQEICPLGAPGTFLMADPSTPCGFSWQEPPSPFYVRVTPASPASATSSAVSASKTVILKSGYKMASTTITNTER